jgi:hypothetical protein
MMKTGDDEPEDATLPVAEAIGAVESGEPVDFVALRALLRRAIERLDDSMKKVPELAGSFRRIREVHVGWYGVVDALEKGNVELARETFRAALRQGMDLEKFD